jgi:hypothetical protein
MVSENFPFFYSSLDRLYYIFCLLIVLMVSLLFYTGECPLDPGGYFIVKGIEEVTKNSDAMFSMLSLLFRCGSCTTLQPIGSH